MLTYIILTNVIIRNECLFEKGLALVKDYDHSNSHESESSKTISMDSFVSALIRRGAQFESIQLPSGTRYLNGHYYTCKNELGFNTLIHGSLA